jgi:hypothetical protein
MPAFAFLHFSQFQLPFLYDLPFFSPENGSTSLWKAFTAQRKPASLGGGLFFRY